MIGGKELYIDFSVKTYNVKIKSFRYARPIIGKSVLNQKTNKILSMIADTLHIIEYGKSNLKKK